MIQKRPVSSLLLEIKSSPDRNPPLSLSLAPAAGSAVVNFNVNLNGHCFICLKCEDNLSTTEDASVDLPKGEKIIASFYPLLCYLAGYPHIHPNVPSRPLNRTEEEDVRGEFELPFMTVVPPLCEQCHDNLEKLYGLHEQLLELENKIQRQTLAVRNRILATTIRQEGHVRSVDETDQNEMASGYSDTGGTTRDLFLESLQNSVIPMTEMERSSNLVVQVHDQIISKGNAPVIFPILKSTNGVTGNGNETMNFITSPNSNSGTMMDVEIQSADNLPVGSTGEKQKVQVEFITIEQLSDEASHVYVTPMEGEVASDDQYVIGITGETGEQLGQLVNAEESESQQVIQGQGPTIIAPEQELTVAQTDVIDGDNVNIGGVPVDPNANFVMITTNVTDPSTGAVSVQPILISVRQLQAMQLQQPPVIGSSLPMQSSTTVDQFCKSGNSKGKSFKKEPVGAYSTPSEYVYYKEDLQPCDVCNARIPRGSEIASHLATHVGSDYVFYCPGCQIGFISPFRLQKYHCSKPMRCRLDSSPLTGPVFSCDQCEFQTDKMQAFRKHLDDHDSKEDSCKTFQCPLCPLRFTSKKCVEAHLDNKHVFTKPSGRQKCDICGSFFDLGEIEAHLWTHGIRDILRCKLCMCMFSSVESMIQHQMAVKRRRIHDMSCHVCGSRFLRAHDLRLHYFEVHKLGDEYLCLKCHENFFTVKSYKSHQNKCVGMESFEKTVEQSPGASCTPEPPASSLKQSQSCHSLTKKICPECGKILSTSDTLLRHRIKEHDHPLLPCSRLDCHQAFSSKADLRTHVATDHKGFTIIHKLYPCDQCGDSFLKKDKLKSHKFVKHSNVKPFTCDVCGLQYRNKMTLQCHVNAKHLGMEPEKNKVCDICDKTFSDSQVLKQHRWTHTKERPFQCKNCGQRFRQRTALRMHEKSHAELGVSFKPKGEMERNCNKIKE